jgi:hypothetical protein
LTRWAVVDGGGCPSTLQWVRETTTAHQIERLGTEFPTIKVVHDRRPASGFARAALADMLIPNVDLDSTGTWTTVSTQGDTRP